MTPIEPGETFLPASNTTYRLKGPGAHRRIRVPAGSRNVTIEAEDGAVIDLSRARSHRAREFGIRAFDGGEDLRLLNVQVTGAGHGVRITQASGVVIEEGRYFRNRVEGIHAAGCPGIQVRGVRCEENGAARFPGYTLDKAHGLYLAGDCSGAVVEDCRFEHNRGSGFQANAEDSPDRRMHGLTLRQIVLIDNGAGGAGTGAISLMGVRDSRFCCLYFQDNPNALVVMHALPCVGNECLHYTVEGPEGFTYREEAGSTGNCFETGQGWRPGEPCHC